MDDIAYEEIDIQNKVNYSVEIPVDVDQSNSPNFPALDMDFSDEHMDKNFVNNESRPENQSTELELDDAAYPNLLCQDKVSYEDKCMDVNQPNVLNLQSKDKTFTVSQDTDESNNHSNISLDHSYSRSRISKKLAPIKYDKPSTINHSSFINKFGTSEPKSINDFDISESISSRKKSYNTNCALSQNVGKKIAKNGYKLGPRKINGIVIQFNYTCAFDTLVDIFSHSVSKNLNFIILSNSTKISYCH